jgi:hypothetical protein
VSWPLGCYCNNPGVSSCMNNFSPVLIFLKHPRVTQLPCGLSMMDCLFFPETCQKPAGNLRKTKKKRFLAGFRNPSLTDHMVVSCCKDTLVFWIDPGNALEWVHAPLDFWDISFCTRRILTNFITFLKSLIKVEVATDFSFECDRRKDNCGERNFV